MSDDIKQLIISLEQSPRTRDKRAAAEIQRLTAELATSRQGALEEAVVRVWHSIEAGFEAWKAKPHNAKWWRKIDGTPIPNDLRVNMVAAVQSDLRALMATPREKLKGEKR